MAFDYGRLTGPIDLRGDSLPVSNYKAGTGALVYGLRRAGWSDEQIANSLRGHFESAALVLVEHILDHFIRDRRGVGTVSAWTVAQDVVAEIHPRLNPCGRNYCAVCNGG